MPKDVIAFGGFEMRRFATVGAAFLSLLAGAADAAGLPAKIYTKAPPLMLVHDWSGFYIGLNAGGASSHKWWTIFSNNGLAVVPTAEGCHDATGGLAGGQLGYRWHLFMGTKDVTFPVSAVAVTRSDHIGQDVDMGTVRVNYRFSGIVAKH